MNVCNVVGSDCNIGEAICKLGREADKTRKDFLL